MDVVAVVRVGPPVPGGPGPLTPIRGTSMIAWTVRGLLGSGAVDLVQVLTSAPLLDEVRAVVDDPTIFVSAESSAATDRWGVRVLVVHDAARPLVPASLVSRVVAAALEGHAVTVPVLPLTDTVKAVDARGMVAGAQERTGLRVVQTPQAFRVDLIAAALSGVLAAASGQAYAAAGRAAHTVEGHPHAFAVRSGWDLLAAEVLLRDVIG